MNREQRAALQAALSLSGGSRKTSIRQVAQAVGRSYDYTRNVLRELRALGYVTICPSGVTATVAAVGVMAGAVKLSLPFAPLRKGSPQCPWTGLTVSRSVILQTLCDRGAMTLVALARASGYSVAAVGLACNALEALGLAITRRRDVRGRRIRGSIIEATSAGRRLREGGQ